ncbi:MAG: DUF4388 domain-containing protein [Candidatus Sumerlaeia bacterium]|nr:DUF4388 domain-containing protein [Candidatus Sumerlaeia bacterium]
MELEGSLRAFSLAEVLQFLAMGKLSGVLMVRREQGGIDLLIRQGRIINSSTLDQTRRMGQILIRQRLIQRSDLEEVLLDQKTLRPDRMLGQILVEREMITQDELRQAIRMQLEEEIWELFSWESGDFRFEHRQESEMPSALVEIEIEPLIIEGTRRTDEWKGIIANLRSDETVLTLNPWHPEDHADLTLTPAEWQVLSLISGNLPVGSIAARSGIGKFETYRILNTYLMAGIATIKPDPTGAAAMDESGRNGDTSRRAVPGILGLFAKKRGEGGAAFERNEKFLTPLGLVGRFVELVVRLCFEHRDFTVAEGDEYFLQRKWRSILIECPLADLIQVEGNRVDTRPLERYLEMSGVTPATQRVYEDGLEALERLYGATALAFAPRLGERHFQRIVQTLQTEWYAGAQIAQQRRFNFDRMLSRGTVRTEGDR